MVVSRDVVSLSRKDRVCCLVGLVDDVVVVVVVGEFIGVLEVVVGAGND